jgi:hypothetical protein
MGVAGMQLLPVFRPPCCSKRPDAKPRSWPSPGRILARQTTKAGITPGPYAFRPVADTKCVSTCRA